MVRRDDAGASAPFSFAVAGGILIVIIGALMVATQQSGRDDSRSQDENLRGDAAALVDIMVSSSGAGWESGPDAVTEMGLLNANGSGIDSSRLLAMKGAVYDADPDNGKLDYNETLLLLGLDPDGAAQFHIRIAPVGLVRVLSSDLSGIRTAYIGDYGNPDPSFSVSFSLTHADMVTDARSEIDSEMSSVARSERHALTQLGLGFDNETSLTDWDVDVTIPLLPDEALDAIVDPDMLEGDVYPDEKLYLNSIIPSRIDEYEVVIIGSNVDHSTLTSNAFKAAIEAWVEAGGTLIVFGSNDQSFQWLQALMGAGIETANGGAFAPDVDHPLLREPHQLDWPAYENFDQTWGGKSGKNNDFDDKFQHIISDADNGDVLAVSLDGAFGDGRIFLSTYRPADIASEISLQEAMNLVNNIVVYSDRSSLFLDYGPPPPQDASVGAASRTSYIWDPDFGQVPVRVTVLAWGT